MDRRHGNPAFLAEFRPGRPSGWAGARRLTTSRLKKLFQEPKEMTTAGMAVACVAFIFLLKFFADLSVASLVPQPNMC